MTGELQRNCSRRGQPLRRADVTVHELDGEALVFDATSGDTHRLNHTALFIWQQCDGGQDARRVAKKLAQVYDVSVESALEHVERIISEFQERRLIVTADRSGPGTGRP